MQRPRGMDMMNARDNKKGDESTVGFDGVRYMYSLVANGRCRERSQSVYAVRMR